MGTNDVALLQGRHEPATHERSVDLTHVEGEIPQDLNGPHVRNGPNRRFEAPGRYDWFDGDGMPHGLPSVFHEWRINLGTGQTRDRVIDHIVDQEFPVINSWMQGHMTRYSWNLLMGRLNRPVEPRSCGLVRYDLEREHVPHGFHATRVSAERLQRGW